MLGCKSLPNSLMRVDFPVVTSSTPFLTLLSGSLGLKPINCGSHLKDLSEKIVKRNQNKMRLLWASVNMAAIRDIIAKLRKSRDWQTTRDDDLHMQVQIWLHKLT